MLALSYLRCGGGFSHTQKPLMLIPLYFYVSFLIHIHALLATHHATAVVNAL